MYEIFQQNGEVTKYLSVAERQPLFLAEYGLEQGYKIRNSVKDYLALRPELAQLYRIALEAGMDLAKLPPIEPIFCFESTLLNEDDVVLAEASALRRIDMSNPLSIQEYFWESGETAAYQRLMARLGFGSETLLADEQRDMDAHGVHASEDSAKEEEEDNAKATSDSDAKAPTPADATSVDNAGTEDTPGETPKATSEPSKSKKAENPAKPPTGRTRMPKATANSSEVQDAVLRQIRNLAAQRGIEPPVVANKAEAKEALKSLRATPAPT